MFSSPIGIGFGEGAGAKRGTGAGSLAGATSFAARSRSWTMRCARVNGAGRDAAVDFFRERWRFAVLVLMLGLASCTFVRWARPITALLVIL